MQAYITTARGALADLDEAADRLRRGLATIGGPPVTRLALESGCGAVRDAIAQLLGTLFILEQTGLDVVDLQARLRQETRALIDPLLAIDEAAAAADERVVSALRSRLVTLEERAQLAAGALFPSAARGLDAANDLILFRLRPLVLPRYTREVEKQMARGRWTATRRQAVESLYRVVDRTFRDVNAFLNRLATSPPGGDGVTRRVSILRERLAEVERQTREAARDDRFDGFGGVLGDVRKIAREARRALTQVEVPVFPPWSRLGPLRPAIDARLYETLSGVQRFALLNIAARMQSIEIAGETLLAPRFGITVSMVFPDRVYLETDRALIDLVAATRSIFEPAPAGLHRYNDGSFKQTTFRRGNLQLSYARHGATRMNVDADIDLYRGPVSHLFGEVLVNRLTGSKTDQFEVHRILVEHAVPPIGPFAIVRPGRTA